MLCGASPARISSTYNDLLNLDVSVPNACVDWLGGPTNPGAKPNPCRAIVEQGLSPGSEARRSLVETEIYAKHFNTNYTASWWLVRSGLLLDGSGNLASSKPGCLPNRLARHSSLGPLSPARADTASVSSCFIPLLGCGRASQPLTMPVGPIPVGAPTAQSFTPGPVTNPGMDVPHFEEGTPQNVWREQWQNTVQDFRGFAPVHRGMCNLLFADGSVRSFADRNEDGLLNNGFTPTAENGFADGEYELPKEEVMSAWRLK